MDLNILKFKTRNNRYIFDGNSSKIFVEDESMDYILENWEKNSDVLSLWDNYDNKNEGITFSQFVKKYEYIAKLINKGYFLKRQVINEKLDIHKEKYNTSNMALIIVLTGQCNLRCKYCVYGEHYPDEVFYDDIKDMSFDTARKAIDEYVEFYKDKVAHGYFKIPSIFFYGGEPLLKKKLIKRIVEYTKLIEFKCNFYMTTNGVLLDEEFSEFCVDNNFTITFSLDGYKFNHDRNRVSVNDKPTFDIVYENIKKYEIIKKNKNNMNITSFNCCYDDYTDIEKCVDFFIANGEIFGPMYVVYSYINPYETDYYEWLEDNSIDEKCFQSSFKKVYEKFINGIYKSKIQKAATQNLFLGMHSMSIRNTSLERSALNNCCMPLTKIAVYPDGIYTICERMNKKMPIGNVDDGINYKVIQEIIDKMSSNFTQGRCKECTVKNLCNICFQFVDEECTVKDEYCKREKEAIINRLMQYCDILEKNPNAFEESEFDEKEVELLKVLG